MLVPGAQVQRKQRTECTPAFLCLGSKTVTLSCYSESYGPPAHPKTGHPSHPALIRITCCCAPSCALSSPVSAGREQTAASVVARHEGS
eukprot:2182710-Lingulodinium_polyedra.AAC.1